MDKLKMQTANKADENFRKLAELFPNAVTETIDENGEVVRAIDKDVLMQEISCTVVDGKEERYQFTWPDKKKSVLLANAPINKTLRPCREESVGRDGTPGGFDSENLYIEGDNLEVLKVLRETYLRKVKMIYIDPPYNTGNDFVYKDDFAQSMEEYTANSGQFDEEGNRLVKNMDTNGRFHTDWLNMMYPRLKLAKDLLTDDGVIFISVDDNEQGNLKKICDEIFGESNLLLTMCIKKGSEIASNYIIQQHEYLLVYVKYLDSFVLNGKEKITISRGTVGNKDQTMPIIDFPAGLRCYNMKDGTYDKTRWIDGSLENIENFDPIIIENGKLKYPVKMRAKWRSSNDMRAFFNNNCKKTQAKINGDIIEIYFENDRFNPQIKKSTYQKIPSLFLENKRGSKDLEKLDLYNMFDYPKSIDLIKFLISLICKNDIILDFFSGSATTAQAVMQLNAEDGGRRKFIMVQLPEETDEKSEAYKAGYKNICEIGKERIRRAGKKIKEENPLTTQNLDTGFRVFKLDSSNMEDVYYTPSEFNENLLFIDNIKPDRTNEDLLFQTMLDLGIELSAKIEKKEIAGKEVLCVDENYLTACFDKDVNEATITQIAKMKPYYFIMRDSSMATDNVADNFEQIFNAYSPETIRKIL